MKLRSALRRLCINCYMVRRQGRLFVYCKSNPRHKQRQGRGPRRKLHTLEEVGGLLANDASRTTSSCGCNHHHSSTSSSSAAELLLSNPLFFPYTIPSLPSPVVSTSLSKSLSSSYLSLLARVFTHPSIASITSRLRGVMQSLPKIR